MHPLLDTLRVFQHDRIVTPAGKADHLGARDGGEQVARGSAAQFFDACLVQECADAESVE